MRHSPILAFALLLAACASAPGHRAPARYMCDNGRAFFARFDTDQVVLDFGGGVSKSLGARPNAPTGTYGSDADGFRILDDHTAMLSEPGAPPASCMRGTIHDIVPQQR